MSIYIDAYYSFKAAALIRFDAKWWSLLYMACVWLFFYILGISCSIFEGERKIHDIATLLSCSVIHTMAVVKSFSFMTRWEQIRHLFDRLEAIGEVMFRDDKNTIFLREEEKLLKKLLRFVFVFLLQSPILSMTLGTIFDYMSNFENKVLLIPIWVPWSIEKTWAYILAKLWLCLLLVIAMTIYRGFIYFDFVFTFQISTYLKILQNYLESNGVKDEKIFVQHQVFIQLINDYNKIMSGAKFTEIVFTPTAPCGFGLLLLKSLKRNDMNKLDIVQNFLNCLIPPLITCLCGQEIINQVERLHEVSYMSNWYEQNTRCRKDLLTLMIRTNKVTTVNYRLFVTFDNDCLSQVLQRIYSFFMVMAGIVDQCNN